MFKKTDPNPQLDMFTSPTTQLCSRASKKYTDPNSWHNMFYRLYTSKVDEELFKPLFPEGKKSGRPTASIRVLVSMSWLKEGFGCSDEELFEKIEFDLLTRKALGIEHISDAPPSLDTYYLFRRRLCDYYDKTQEDLLQKCFEQVTGSLVKLLKISGKSIRMDSKLIGSNIARQSRYELIHSTLVKFLKGNVLDRLPDDIRLQADAYLKEDSSKTVYRSDSDTLQSRLQAIGDFIHAILQQYHAESSNYGLLKRVFDEQYLTGEDGATRRPYRPTASRTPTTLMPAIVRSTTRRYKATCPTSRKPWRRRTRKARRRNPASSPRFRSRPPPSQTAISSRKLLKTARGSRSPLWRICTQTEPTKARRTANLRRNTEA